jgi:hypothetical protein
VKGALDRIKQIDTKVEKQAAEIADLRRSVEALNRVVADRREPVRSAGGL